MDDADPAPAPGAAGASANPRHVAFARKREETFKAARAARRAELQRRAPEMTKAVQAYASLDRGDHPDIRIRRGFVRLATARAEPDTDMPYKARRKDDLATRPPLTKLIHRSPNALPVLLTAIYVAHLENPPGMAVSNDLRHNTFTENGLVPWVTLAGMSSGPRTARHRRLRRALVELEKYDLIATGSVTHRFKCWTLAAEDGSGRRYEVPGDAGPAQATVRVPAWFFLQGWHLVLEPREIATLLMVLDMAQSLPYSAYVGIPTKTRRSLYCLPDDTYSESIHELHDFGLIELHDPMAEHRVQGKLADREQDLKTYQMTVRSQRPRHSDLSTKPALDVVLDDLTHKLPGRLYEDLMDPRELPSWLFQK